MENETARDGRAKRKPGRPRKLTDKMASHFLELYACSPAGIRAISRKLGFSDRTLYRYLRRDADFFRRYQQASESHLSVWLDRFDSADYYLGNMKQAWKDWRVLSALIARARESPRNMPPLPRDRHHQAGSGNCHQAPCLARIDVPYPS